MECTWDADLLKCGDQLPSELLDIIRRGSNELYLRAITEASLKPRYTYILFAHCENIFAHVCANLRHHGNIASAVATLGRIIPFAPYLVSYAEEVLSNEKYTFSPSGSSEDDLLYLLGLFRLLRYEWRTFKPFVRPTEIALLLESQSRPIAYLAIRILQIYLSSADHWFEEMVKRYLGEDTPEGDINGLWDDQVIDYRFLTLWEEHRYAEVWNLRSVLKDRPTTLGRSRVIPKGCFDNSAALVGSTLFPRMQDTPQATVTIGEDIVRTPTISSNIELVAQALREQRPLLLTGLAGSGKTLLIRHVAQSLGKLDKMVTLHLNEQSDAKLLIGIYTTGETPGSFIWKPGVLTTAVQEGRWILIEDLDRAPNEIIGTLLPLIERGELLIPNRKHNIHAAQGFRVIATMRSLINHRGEKTNSAANMLGARHWQHVSIETPSLNELKEITNHLYPSLVGLSPQFIAVYDHLQASRRTAILTGQSKTGVLRTISPRDLLKWCSRVENLLHQKSTFTSNDMDDIFTEAIDCFVGALPNSNARAVMTGLIAEELHINPQRRDYLIHERSVRYDAEKTRIVVGRYSLVRSQSSKKAISGHSSFTPNPHTNRMLERVAAGTVNREPLLLVGETGVGKTAAVQHLASQLGKKLVPFNMSQQSEAGDLLGGFKPISAQSLIVPMKDEFDELFTASFSLSKNQQFLELLGKQMSRSNWKAVCKLWRQALKMVEAQRQDSVAKRSEAPSKKRKVEFKQSLDFSRWDAFAAKVTDLEQRLSSGNDAFAFRFVEGNIVKALRNGDWLLLDEINLASPDTLEAIVDLFDPRKPSLILSESGSIERIEAHPEFRVFAAMNPATDVGKKDLPLGIRSRFTELYVESPDKDIKSLQSIVHSFLRHEIASDQAVPLDASTLYQKIIGLAEHNRLVDGAGQKPHFSLRTLTRTLSYAKYIAPMCSLRRALYEGFQMTFMTFLDSESSRLVQPLLEQHLLGKRTNVRAELRKALRKPINGNHVQGYPGSKHWVRQGDLQVEEQSHYILTPFICTNLENLIRATSTRQFPVLIQGPTSSGKTSMIEYLAKRTGHQFVRINNHEHTDLHEYLGTYVSGLDGRLQFQEGVLVKAVREGHWVVLDELNLAPTDVLEALNRLLDDNRELLIPETQEIVRPHENFMLFATQNPAGLYAGRKTLSRAFRNRFLELHFDDIPIDELQEILHRRTQLPESRCKRIVNIYRELSVLRQENRLFEQKSFATLRDLFRWALRSNETTEKIAHNGFMLLGERVRKVEERNTLKDIIEKAMSMNGPRISVDESLLYGQGSPEILHYQRNVGNSGVVWTTAMRRLYTLVARAIENHEPVLLIGDTGSGKTTVCQMLADAFGKKLHTVNVHQNTETGDLIGSQRPVRNRAAIEATLRHQVLSSRLLQHADVDPTLSTDALLNAYDLAISGLDKSEQASYCHSATHLEIQIGRTRHKGLFEWIDGSLVQAMKEGSFFLLDEISLADDSVLERLNSVLESQRSVMLAEKGSLDSYVTAMPDFQFFATMNPGGDYGKRELSPALRNRFTEIWVPPLNEVEDVTQIVHEKLIQSARSYADAMVSFAQWFKNRYNTSSSFSVSIRDALAWVTFVNTFGLTSVGAAVIHGAAMVYIDTLGANPAGLMTLEKSSIDVERHACLDQLSQLLQTNARSVYFAKIDLAASTDAVTAGPFSLQKKRVVVTPPSAFSFEAPTAKLNTLRVFRALQLVKPVMLEGNPGVGKTALITAIADLAGTSLTRINLSEHTDLIDLFGSDVPAEGAGAGTFVWRDAPFLRAMKSGEWVLLDEMNLASQSVLEGLNACLDHRGEVFIPELGRSFSRHPDFRLFAAQNPHHQGGGRKGLPASFVNRFTVVFADAFSFEDLMLISQRSFPQVDVATIAKVVSFVDQLDRDVTQTKRIGTNGAPWEFNLRDVSRLLSLASSDHGLFTSGTLRDFVDFLFSQRFRLVSDRSHVNQLLSSFFEHTRSASDLYSSVSSQTIQLGLGLLSRDPNVATMDRLASWTPNCTDHLKILQSVMICVQQKWPVVLTGTSGSGKTALIERLASTVGATLVSIAMNSESDAMDLVGGYEQADPNRHDLQSLDQMRNSLEALTRARLVDRPNLESLGALEQSNAPIPEDPTVLVQLMHTMQRTISTEALECSSTVEDSSQNVRQGHFEWTDGLVIDAIQKGSWLVLDNANLCSPSVLDRLNSLLEPDGVLIVNENSNEDGSPRVITPHPDFRIFLTLNPQYGELSRAMRNRAVELHLPKTMGNDAALSVDPLRPESVLGRLQRLGAFRTLDYQNTESESFTNVAVDHFGHADLPLLRRFAHQIDSGLYSLPQECRASLRAALPAQLRVANKDSPAVKMFQTAVGQSQAPADFAYVQTLHPLNNQALIQSSPHILSLASSLAVAYDLSMHLYPTRMSLDSVQSNTTLVAKTGRLERSLGWKTSTSHSQANSNGILGIIARILQRLSFWTEKPLSVPSAHFVKVKMSSWQLMALSALLLQAIKDDRVDAAVPGVFLSIGQSIVHEHSLHIPLQLASDIYDMHDLFRPAIEMAGPSKAATCTALWKVLRPATPRTIAQLEQLLRFEAVIDSFDRACCSFDAPLETIVSLRRSFSRALDFSTQGGDNLEELTAKIEHLMFDADLQDAQVDVLQTPHFCESFKRLSAHFATLALGKWHLPSSESITLEILALRKTKEDALASDQNSPQHRFQLLGSSVDPILEDPANEIARDVLGDALVQGLRTIGQVSIARLELLETEIKALGKAVCSQAHMLADNQLAALDLALKEFAMEVIGVLAEGADEVQTRDTASSLLAYMDSGNDETKLRVEMDRLARVAEHTFSSSVLQSLVKVVTYLRTEHINENLRLLGATKAWLSFGCACLGLYVSRTAFDPALDAKWRRDIYNHVHGDLISRLDSLQRFRHLTTGEPNTLRASMLQEDIVALGQEPPTDQICRPRISQLSALQSDLDGLMRTLHPVLESLEHDLSDLPLDPNLLSNLVRIRGRLAQQYRAYDDYTSPIVGFVNCLLTAHRLSLRIKTSTEEHSERVLLHRIVPFVNASLKSWLSDKSFVDANTNLTTQSETLCWMDVVAVRSKALPLTKCTPQLRQVVEQQFFLFYRQWQSELQKEQKTTAIKSSTYKYRPNDIDSTENTFEELEELFPTSETTSTTDPTAKAGLSARELSQSIARLHCHVFASEPIKHDSMRRLLRRWFQTVSDNSGQVNDENLLPAIIEELGEASLPTSRDGEMQQPNIYTDTNDAEVKSLLNVMKKAVTRFRGLQRIWPDHATPTEVLRMSEKLFESPLCTPLARLLPRMEALHTTINEWQKIASREFSVLDVLDEVTALIIKWRRLELSSWAGLFDRELEQCRTNAASWWYIAYETIIAASSSAQDSPKDLSRHAEELLKTLGDFIVSSGLGDFSTRLNMLRGFEAHIAVKEIDTPALKAVHNALKNFNAFYSHFEEGITKKLTEGRNDLEKQVKDVIQVASWRDRNIDVLRQSAKSSHAKLLRLVRKFRNLLAEPVAAIIRSGIPRTSTINGLGMLNTASSRAAHYPTTQVSLPPLPSWEGRADRFRNSSATANLISSKVMVIHGRFSAPRELELFRNGLEQSIVELRRATPSVLKDENQALVKHLKTRKRRLLADVLKELRQMGFQSSLSEQVLSQQSNTLVVLAQLPSMRDYRTIADTAFAEQEFYRLLDTMLHVRESARKHSGDLTSAEVARSLTLLESIVQVSVKQYRCLSEHMAMAIELATQLDQFHNLGFCDAPIVESEGEQNHSYQIASMTLFENVIDYGLALLRTQERLSGESYTHIMATIESKRMQAEQVRLHATRLPSLPPKVQTRDHAKFHSQAQNLANDLHSHLEEAFSIHPEIQPLMAHLQRWTGVSQLHESQSQTNGHRVVTYTTWIADLFQTIDIMLASVQEIATMIAVMQEDNGRNWLLSQQDLLDQALKTLRVDTATKNMSTLLSNVQFLGGREGSSLRSVAAISKAVLPIIEAYFRSVSDLIHLFCELYAQINKTGCMLAESVIQLNSQGFCSPSGKAPDDGAQSGDVEAGTGLGEGDGAEDISKDIGDTEDLSELAQDAQGGDRTDNMEDEKDAVDMADEEMEGEADDFDGGAEDDQDGEDDEPGDDSKFDEEPAENGLGEGAVDEKMWDSGKDTTTHDKEDARAKGDAVHDDFTAAEEQVASAETNDDVGKDDEPEPGDAEKEAIPSDAEKMDPHMQDESSLDLPEEMEIGRKKANNDDESDIESMLSDHTEEGQDGEGEQTADATMEDDVSVQENDYPEGSDPEPKPEEAAAAQAPENGGSEDHDDAMPDTSLQQEQYTDLREPSDNGLFAEDDSGSGKHHDADRASATQDHQMRTVQEDSADRSPAECADGQGQGLSTATNGTQQPQEASMEDHRLPLKQLGDVLEEWYQNHGRAAEAASSEETLDPPPQDLDLAKARFEHLADNDATADAQILDVASAEQSSALNEDSGLSAAEDRHEAGNDTPSKQEHTTGESTQDDRMQVDSGSESLHLDQATSFVGGPRHFDTEMEETSRVSQETERDGVEDVDDRLTNTHLSHEGSQNDLSFEEARRLWNKYDESTRQLALVLTEHLRLILEPTQATKMRGDFRTGKRLNIKRIIPYIASSYKRDKIWMRRSVPSKRSYQIMLAIDDSKSMTDNRSHDLAFETLALVAKSMSMLELGQLSVIGFGEDVRIAHHFDTPFTSDAGAQIFRSFTFQQRKTNVHKLLSDSISLFQTARLKAAGSASDLWQLQLIISDGICEDHPSIRQLVRRAHEERIMIVFIVIDAAVPSTGSVDGSKQSILDLQTAEFVNDTAGEMQLKMTKYLDTFPFQYYLILRDVQELPNVLAGALRQWFAEVVETGG